MTKKIFDKDAADLIDASFEMQNIVHSISPKHSIDEMLDMDVIDVINKGLGTYEGIILNEHYSGVKIHQEDEDRFKKFLKDLSELRITGKGLYILTDDVVGITGDEQTFILELNGDVYEHGYVLMNEGLIVMISENLNEIVDRYSQVKGIINGR